MVYAKCLDNYVAYDQHSATLAVVVLPVCKRPHPAVMPRLTYVYCFVYVGFQKKTTVLYQDDLGFK